MTQLTLTLAAISGFLCVALGAFGAHALRNRLDDYALGIFETAVQYQFYHSLALLAVGLLMLQVPASALLRSSALLFIAGICVFSGSLYILSFSGLRWMGAITPLGGLALIGGWLCLAAAAWTVSAS
ncbi:MAG: DUF423 domain-containing protein [Pseudomonadota bacterium]